MQKFELEYILFIFVPVKQKCLTKRKGCMTICHTTYTQRNKYSTAFPFLKVLTVEIG